MKCYNPGCNLCISIHPSGPRRITQECICLPDTEAGGLRGFFSWHSLPDSPLLWYKYEWPPLGHLSAGLAGSVCGSPTLLLVFCPVFLFPPGWCLLSYHKQTPAQHFNESSGFVRKICERRVWENVFDSIIQRRRVRYGAGSDYISDVIML